MRPLCFHHHLFKFLALERIFLLRGLVDTLPSMLECRRAPVAYVVDAKSSRGWLFFAGGGFRTENVSARRAKASVNLPELDRSFTTSTQTALAQHPDSTYTGATSSCINAAYWLQNKNYTGPWCVTRSAASPRFLLCLPLWLLCHMLHPRRKKMENVSTTTVVCCSPEPSAVAVHCEVTLGRKHQVLSRSLMAGSSSSAGKHVRQCL